MQGATGLEPVRGPWNGLSTMFWIWFATALLDASRNWVIFNLCWTARSRRLGRSSLTTSTRSGELRCFCRTPHTTDRESKMPKKGIEYGLHGKRGIVAVLNSRTPVYCSITFLSVFQRRTQIRLGKLVGIELLFVRYHLLKGSVLIIFPNSLLNVLLCSGGREKSGHVHLNREHTTSVSCVALFSKLRHRLQDWRSRTTVSELSHWRSRRF